MSSSRWIAVGSALLGVGVLIAVSWLVYVRQAHEGFWSWLGTAGVIVAGVGLVMLITGFLMPKDNEMETVRQVQIGGSNSRNIQAGRNIKFGNDKSGE